MITQRFNEGDGEAIRGDSILFDSEFWDCKCKTNWIHPVEDTECQICQEGLDEAPESRVGDVEKLTLFYIREKAVQDYLIK